MVFLVKVLVKLIKLMIVALKLEFSPFAPLLHKLEEIIAEHEKEEAGADADETTAVL